MPKYQCHKKVWALKIRMVKPHQEQPNDGGAFLEIEDGDFSPILVDRAYMEKHNPVAGGYYVVYEDGYKSFSPAEAFESGYTRI
jgi:hypothetical protein